METVLVLVMALGLLMGMVLVSASGKKWESEMVMRRYLDLEKAKEKATAEAQGDSADE